MDNGATKPYNPSMEVEDRIVRQRVWVEIPERTLKRIKIKAVELDTTMEALISAVIIKAFEGEKV